MAYRLLEFLEQILTDTYLINLIQFEKTGSIGK